MATLFVYDDASRQFVRRTTNLKKENGDRAVGTQLAADHPAQPVVRKGEAYKGPAILFSQRYYTAYYPIFDRAGKPSACCSSEFRWRSSTACSRTPFR